jgi:hypothetical protein
MTAITADARRIYRSEMQAARDAGDPQSRWRHLGCCRLPFEKAHFAACAI